VISAASVHGGTSLGYEWDGAMRLVRVTNYVASPDIVSEYTHNGLDREVQYNRNDLNNTPVTTYQHDGFGRLRQVQTLGNGAPLAQFTYTLGDSGVRKTLAEVGPAIQTPATRTINYAYDRLYRSTAETISGANSGLNGSVGYVHDNVGNRLTRTLTSAESVLAAKVPAGSSTYTPQDRLEPASNFDLNGNTLLGDVSPAQTAADIYNFDNRLIQRSTTIGGQAATVVLVYDGDGNRVKKSVTIGGNTTTTYFVVDDRSPTGYPQVLEELTRSGSLWVVQRSYTYGERLLIQHRPGASEWRFVCQDGHGSTRFLTDLSGTITDRYTYDAFGILVASTGSTPNNYLYACEQFDPDLGLYYLRARYYNPFTGRFWTMDTFQGDPNNPLSSHKYLYAYADPVNKTDPSGHDPRISVTTGYVVSGTGQHIVPFSIWDEIGFDEDAMMYLDEDQALIAAPDHNSTAHPRYTHEVRTEWERFLDSSAGKKYKSRNSYGRDAAEAFLKHVKSAGNPYIDGFNAAVGGGPAEVRRWFTRTGSKIAPSTLKSSIWKNAAKRLGKKIPYVNYLTAGVTYTSALASARAARDTEAVAQLEALAEVFNPLPFSQQDIRDAQEAGKRFWTRKQLGYEMQRFGGLLD